MGFSLALPSVARRTSNGIPRYDGTDVFVYSDEGDLVPGLRWDPSSGHWVPDARVEPAVDPVWDVVGYRPRREADFRHIERWTSRLDRSSHWRVLMPDNSTWLFGTTEEGRIYDPDYPDRIFQWLPQELRDAHGNKAVYHYKREDDIGVSGKIYELGRDHRSNRYLKRIDYGNYLSEGTERFACQVVFDYGEYPPAESERPPGQWAVRPDPFSSYRSGFEVRTLRRCRAILIYHCLADEFAGQPFLTRTLEFDYDDHPMSFVRRVTETGFRRQADGSYRSAPYPPVDFGYSAFEPDKQQYRELAVDLNGSLPSYLGGQYLLADLEGEGLPGVLYSDDATTLYWPPLGGGRYAGPINPRGFPTDSDLGGSGLVLTSLQGNGRAELVVRAPSRAGYYRSEGAGRWAEFRPFNSAPTDLSDPATQFVDMTGAGRADVAVLDTETIKTWPSLGLAGYGPPELAPSRAGFPVTAGSGATELVTFADMFGDGLSHRVRIKDGEVEVWPNLGYGAFGQKVNLGSAPRFHGGFDPRRLYLADIDGSGPADLIYVQPDRVQVFFNRSGNSLSQALSIPLPAPYDNVSQVSFGDVYGNGTTCLILTKLTPAPVHYVYDFAGDGKPYLLTSVANKMGATTRIEYASSVKQYLADRRAGRPWASKLHFPVQVVTRLTRTDETTGTRYVTRYRHHDGYYDTQYRQFQGFGFVETWDTEDLADFTAAVEMAGAAGAVGGTISPIDAADYVPPVYGRTWFHTGVLLDVGVISRQYASEYWAGDPQAWALPESSFDPDLDVQDAETLRQAYAALAGSVLRQEVYGLDGTPAEANPYTVNEASYEVRLVQPRHGQRFAVFLAYPRENLTYSYDRVPADPSVAHEFALAVDEFGNVRRACEVAYPRRNGAAGYVYPEQREMHVTVVDAAYINHVETDAEPYRWTGVKVDERHYEIGGLTAPPGCFVFDQLRRHVQEALHDPLGYGQPFTPGEVQARLYSWTRSYYWNEQLTDPLPVGGITAPGLLHHEETAVAPPSLIAQLFDGKGNPDELMAGRGYWRGDGYWWNRGLIQHYLAEPAAHFMPGRIDGQFPGVLSESSLNPTTTIDYDKYHIMPVRVSRYIHGSDSAATALVVRADNDYHVFLPWRVTDANDNVTEVAFDPLGVVVVSTVYGRKNGEPVGDDPLSDYSWPPDPSFDAVVADPAGYVQRAAAYFFYDLFAWVDRGQPPSAVGVHRLDYVHERPSVPGTPQVGITYSDGFGRVIENRLKTEPTAEMPDRWIVSGQVTYNNKALELRRYLPRFSPTPRFEPDWSPGDELPPPIVSHYDPLGRLIRTDSPKGFFSKTVYSPWEIRAYDEDDTVIESRFFSDFPADPTTAAEKSQQAALRATVRSYNTPAVAVLNTSGRTVRTLANNLGGVTPADLAPIVEGSGVTPQQLWDELVSYGYLVPDSQAPDLGWVSDLVQPYDRGFQARLAAQFGDLAPALATLLKENGLTTLTVLDIAGNAIEQIDPRLLYSNVIAGTDYRNLTAAYDMTGGTLVARSTDAGPRWLLPDVFGNPVLSWDDRPVLTARSFDRLGRLVKVENSAGAGPALVTELLVYGETQSDPAERNLNGMVYQHYDPAGLLTVDAYTITGQVAASVRQVRPDYEAAADWTPAAMAAVASQHQYETSSSYDALDQLVALTTPDGITSARSYNVAGQLTRVDAGSAGRSATVVEGAGYNATGLRTAIRYGNGTSTSQGYEDTTLRLISIRTTGPGQTPSDSDRLLQDIGYTFDPVGNVTQIDNRSFQTAFCYPQPVGPGSDYEYDPVYRLLSSTGRRAPADAGRTMEFCPQQGPRPELVPYVQHFGYDDGGNLIEVDDVTPIRSTRRFDIAPDSNRLADVPYDADGNMLALGDLRLSWTFANTLARVELGDGKGDDFYLYDGAGTRVAKYERRHGPADELTVTETIYVGDYQVTRVKAGQPASERHAVNVLDDRSRVCVIEHEADSASWQLRYQLGDNLGSVAWEVDAAGQPLNYQEYLAYGGSAFIAVASARDVAKEFRFTGKELDVGTDLYYYGARYYCAAYGRWLSPDPSGTGSGLNMYAFVEGNPISKVDADGDVGYWVIFGIWLIGMLITLAVGGGGGFTLGHGRGIASAIFMGVLAGLAGTATGGGLALLAGSTTPTISEVAGHSALAAITSALVGGQVGERAMRLAHTRSRQAGAARIRTIATVGTVASLVTGGVIGVSITYIISGTLHPGVLVTLATGVGSAVLSSGAHLGFLRRRGGTIFVNPVPLAYTQRSRIQRATPPPGLVLPANRMLLVMAPQSEADSRYKSTFKGHESDAYQLTWGAGPLRNVVAVHGFHGYVLVPTGAGGNVMRPMAIYDFARYVQHQLQQGPGGLPYVGRIKFISCYGASWNIIAYNAQVLANVTRRTVYAFKGPNAEDYQGTWYKFRPR